MKIRNGFVSNSSSSSFVVLLPENFLENVDYTSNIFDFFEPDELLRFKNTLKEIINDGGFSEWENPFGRDDDFMKDIIDDLFKPYIIADIASGSDDGSTTIVDIDVVKKIMNIK